MPKLLLPQISWIIGLTTCILIASLLLLHPHVGVAEEEQVLLVERHVSGDIAYNAFFDTRSQAVYGGVTYDYLSTEGVEAYIAFSRTASQAIGQRSEGIVPIKVIFSHPLAQGAFEQFAQTYAVEVQSYTIRAVEPNGMRVTISGGPEGGIIVPPHLLKLVTSDITERSATEVKGWIEAVITTTPQNLARMQRDPDVFVTEAAYTLISDAFTAENLARAGATQAAIADIQAQHNRSVQITGPSLYWILEDAGLVPLPVHTQAEM